jgi:hypothetical protein
MADHLSENEHFNNLPPDQAEALALLAEECGELIQAIGKIQRHGLWSEHPDTGIPNQHALTKEIGDVLAALRIAEVQRLIAWANVIGARDRKLIKVRQYLHHAKVTADE